MKAIVIQRDGPPGVLQLRELPTPSPGDRIAPSDQESETTPSARFREAGQSDTGARPFKRNDSFMDGSAAAGIDNPIARADIAVTSLIGQCGENHFNSFAFLSLITESDWYSTVLAMQALPLFRRQRLNGPEWRSLKHRLR